MSYVVSFFCTSAFRVVHCARSRWLDASHLLAVLDKGIRRRRMEVANRAFLQIKDDETLEEGVVM